jgi:hypothetical protein
MDKDKRHPEGERGKDKRHLRLVEKYDERFDNDDFSRFAGPDYSDEPFELGEQDFAHSPHERKRAIEERPVGTWTNPGVSGKSDDGEVWVNQMEYWEQANFVGYGPRGYTRSDDRIYEEVCDALMRHPAVDASNIGVKVEKGIVYLSGKVPSRQMKKLSERVAEDCPGVQDVRNELVVIAGDDDPQGPDAPAKKDLGVDH